MIWVVDFGSQYTGLILRRLRQMGVPCLWKPHHQWEPLSDRVQGVILSGGPQSVHVGSVGVNWIESVWGRVPILGICYGLQLMAAWRRWPVGPAPQGGEFGSAVVEWVENNPFRAVGERQQVWMSHNDVVLNNGLDPEGRVLAVSDKGYVAAVGWPRFQAWGVQFHPEVSHTQEGDQIFQTFAQICGLKPQLDRSYVWDLVKEALAPIEKRDEPVLVAVSGGVDSLVTLELLRHQGFQSVTGVLVDTGLLRPGEVEQVVQVLRSRGVELQWIQAGEVFLKALEGVGLPEVKRRIIGRLFIEVFQQWVSKQPVAYRWLAQGTLYSDVIESHHPQKASDVTIKTHHNVGGLPELLPFGLIEPLRLLFKDEVRWLGLQLGLPESLVYRQPFPGPGLAVRIMGPVTAQKVRLLGQVENILWEYCQQNPLPEPIWQVFAVLGGDITTGVRGDIAHQGPYVAIRMVQSEDAMTARLVLPPIDWIKPLVQRILSQVPAISRVVWDVTDKPPATIEWQ